MDSASSTSRLFSLSFTEKFSGRTYLKSFPGIIRLLNVVLGGLALILSLIGFSNDYSSDWLEDRYERQKSPRYRITTDGRFDTFQYNYGAGYVSERPNVIQLICIVICLVFSGFHLIFLVNSAHFHYGASRAWNRFLNLSAAILHTVGTLNGLFGLLLFRSYCCHVEFINNERHKSEIEGYFRKPCLCYFTPLWEGTYKDDNEYPTLYYNDIPEEIIFHSANPHHFIPHVISLFFMAINVGVYILASIKI